MNHAKPRAPAVHRATAVLAALASTRTPLSLADIAAATTTPKSTVLGICGALTNAGLIARGHDGTYSLGPRIAELSAAAHELRPGVRRVGVSTPPTSRPFYRAEVAAIEAEADSIDAQVRHLETSVDPHEQSSHIRQLLDWGADVLIVDPVNVDGLIDAYAEARRRGVPIVSINGASTGADAVVTTDNAQAGILIAEFTLREIRYSGTVAIVDGTAVTAVIDRVAGFLDTIRPHRHVRLVSHAFGDNTEHRGYHVARRMLAQIDPPDAIFAINDPTAIGVARACREAGVASLITGVDGSTAALEQIFDGGLIVASAAQDPYELGRRGLQLGLQLKNGSPLRQSTILLPTTLVTASRQGAYRAWDAVA